MPAPEPGEKWGILGGAFDPIHNGHLALARDIEASCGLNGVIFVPTLDPSHRTSQPVASYNDRVTMALLAVADLPGRQVSRIEESNSRPSYTLETARALKAAYPDVAFELIIGADQLALLTTWHRWEDLLREMKLVVGSRPGAKETYPPILPADRIEIVETSLVDVSSTEIRSAIKQGVSQEQLSTMVPPAVAEYINKRKLYR